MRTKFRFLVGCASVLFALSAGLSLSSCKDDVDESNMFTFTGKTLFQYVNEDENYSKFAYILSKVRLSEKSQSSFAELLSARGNYTCFAPTNDAIQQYLDSTYLTQGYDYTQIPDSTANYIVRNSIIDCGDNDAYLSTEFLEGALDKTNMEDRYITIAFSKDSVTGMLQTTVNEKSRIIQRDIEVSNGIIHGVDHVLELSTAMLPQLLAQVPNMTIFGKLLTVTGWDKKMMEYKDMDYEYNHPDGCPNISGTFQAYPEHRYIGYTAFVEPDSIYYKEWGITPLEFTNGIPTNWEDVVLPQIKEKCKELYPDATDADVTNEGNSLNQFVSYHLFPERMTWENMIIHFCEYGYAYNNPTQLTIDCYEYYECMGKPRRLLKLTEGSQTEGRRINRHCKYDYKNNFREIEGSVDIPGLLVSPNNGEYHNQALNGFYYPIDGMLVYDSKVRDVVLNERLRWDVSSVLPELITNNFRRIKQKEVTIPPGYFSTMFINDDCEYHYLSYYGSNLPNYQNDEHNLHGQYEVILKLPPVPVEGTYEFRFAAPANTGFGMAQYYFGKNPDNLPAIGLPVDQRLDIYSEAIGCLPDTKDEEYNNSIDKNMRIHGYMKPPMHDCCPTGGGVVTDYLRISAGFPKNLRIRKIVTSCWMKPEETYYLRVKSVLENTSLSYLLDYMELCPKHIYNGVELEDKW